MSFIRIRTINGKEYMYEEHRWRGADGKVKSKSIYLGRGKLPTGSASGGGILGGLLRPIPPEERGLRYIERMMERDAAKSGAVHATAWAKAVTKTAAEKLMAEGTRLTQERDRAQAARDKLSKELGVTFGPMNPTPVEKTSSPAKAPNESHKAEIEATAPDGSSDMAAGDEGSESSA